MFYTIFIRKITVFSCWHSSLENIKLFLKGSVFKVKNANYSCNSVLREESAMTEKNVVSRILRYSSSWFRNLLFCVSVGVFALCTWLEGQCLFSLASGS